MKKVFLIGVLAALGAVSIAQASDTKRIDAVLDAMNARMSRQTDAWFKDGDFPRLIQLLKIQYDMDPTNYEIGTNLGWMLENVQENDQALAVYIRLRTSSPTDMDAAWPEANFFFMHKAYAKIPPLLEPTIKDHDPHPNSYRTLAHAYEKMNMLTDSKRVWELYLPRHPDDLAAKANLNRLLKKLNSGSAK